MDVLFFNGDILTMGDALPSPEAILLAEDGRIKAVGSYEEVFARQDAVCQARDLQGHRLMPICLDAAALAEVPGSLIDAEAFVRRTSLSAAAAPTDWLIVDAASQPLAVLEIIHKGTTIFKYSQALGAVVKGGVFDAEK